MLRKIFPSPIAEDQLGVPKGYYQYDILNFYENINMDFQLCVTLMLLALTLRNFFNVKIWCREKKVKPNKLYCINSNALLIILCFIFVFWFPL